MPVLHRSPCSPTRRISICSAPRTFPHGISYYQPNVQMASLDHAMWFHRPFRADDWLLYSLDSPTAQQRARPCAAASSSARDGKLVASVAQEGLIRVLPEENA